jgi:hypothetical protein
LGKIYEKGEMLKKRKKRERKRKIGKLKGKINFKIRRNKDKTGMLEVHN